MLALGALAAACGSGGSSSEEDSAPGPPEPRETKIVRSDSLRALGVGRQVSEKPQFGTPAGRPSPDLLVYDVIEGDGAEATAGRPLSMHYVGKSLSTGEEFDASWDRGDLFSFTLGAGR